MVTATWVASVHTAAKEAGKVNLTTIMAKAKPVISLPVTLCVALASYIGVDGSMLKRKMNRFRRGM